MQVVAVGIRLISGQLSGGRRAPVPPVRRSAGPAATRAGGSYVVTLHYVEISHVLRVRFLPSSAKYPR